MTSDFTPRANPDPMQTYTRPEPDMADGDECIGACGLATCRREDCRSCDACGAYFDRDVEGASCWNGNMAWCGDCGVGGGCSDETCCGDPDRYRD